MKKTLKLFFVLLLFSCKGEPVKKEKSNDSTDVRKVATETPADQTVEDCYDYLTELVRSSNFPFSEWKIDKNKVNLLIDDDNEKTISCQLIIDNERSGTIGWIEYRKKDGRLMNTSANLEQPFTLKYDPKWKRLFDSCVLGNKNGTGTNNAGLTQHTASETLEEAYTNSQELSLPMKYDYDAVLEEKGFQPIDRKYYSLFSLNHQNDYKMAKLPVINGIKPVILITYNESGQSTWYLFTLNNQYVPVSNMILYTSQELDNGGSKTTIYSISKDYKITITQEAGDKITSKKNYNISKDGKLISL